MTRLAGVSLSSSDKVFWPELGLTKLGLAQYYVDIADRFVPGVADRPLSLVRCPEGRTGDCFYQKHARGSMPDTIRRVTVQERDGPAEYMSVSDIGGVVYLVQIGCLEIHPWLARADRLERPDRLIFDLDPDVDMPFSAVVDAAHELRGVLERLGLACWCRTTGGKGLHVVAPLLRTREWDEVHGFAQGLAEALVRAAPSRYTSEMSKAKRKGKIFIDYMRNAPGATAVANYSTRAREGAPVATPLAWSEVGADLDPRQFTPDSVRERLATLGAEPWDGFDTTRQSVTAAMLEAVRGLASGTEASG